MFSKDRKWPEGQPEQWLAFKQKPSMPTHMSGDKENGHEPGDAISLKQVLLSYGGLDVEINSDGDNHLDFLKDCVLLSDEKILYWQGRIDSALIQAVDIWSFTPASVKVMTGFALDTDGLWKKHAWSIKLLPDGEIAIIETTRFFTAYVGIARSDEFCQAVLNR